SVAQLAHGMAHSLQLGKVDNLDKDFPLRRQTMRKLILSALAALALTLAMSPAAEAQFRRQRWYYTGPVYNPGYSYYTPYASYYDPGYYYTPTYSSYYTPTYSSYYTPTYTSGYTSYYPATYSYTP